MHNFPRGLLIALASLVLVRAHAVGFNDQTTYVLRVRRYLPGIVYQAHRHNINLVYLAKRRLDLRAAVGPPPPRRLVTITAERSSERVVRRVLATPESLERMAGLFRQIQREYGPGDDRVRAQVLKQIVSFEERLRDVAESPESDTYAAALRLRLVHHLRFALWSQDVPDLGGRLKTFGGRDALVFTRASEFKRRWQKLMNDVKHIADSRDGAEGCLTTLRRRTRFEAVEFRPNVK